MSRRNLISIADLSNDEIEQIFDLADAAAKLSSDKVADGRIMATLFYEPSTRTRLSFESAMQRLGGSVHERDPLGLDRRGQLRARHAGR